MKDKIKYDSFLNAIERCLSKELGQDPQTDRKMFDYTMKILRIERSYSNEEKGVPIGGRFLTAQHIHHKIIAFVAPFEMTASLVYGENWRAGSPIR